MKQKGRSARVAALIRQEVARLLQKGLKDPRIGFVSVMSVRMSPDLRYANVYVSLYGSESERKSSLIALSNSSGWVRKEVGKYLRLRVTPEIRFFEDDTLDTVYHMEEVFEEIRAEKKSAPMLQLDFEALYEELQQGESFLLTTHVHPDGDAVGSMLAFYHYLKALGKKHVVCVMDDPVPRRYQDLPGATEIKHWNDELPVFEVGVLLDAGSLERAGESGNLLDQGNQLMVIDHHQDGGPNGALGLIDSSYAATGEIVAELFEATEVPLTQEAAYCAYVAQVTDTGGYRFSNTSPRSHRIAARLIEQGLDVQTISNNVFSVISRPKAKLLRLVLDRLAYDLNGALAWSYVTASDLEAAEAAIEDLDGLISYVRNIEGVQVGILFNALNETTTKVSFRSMPHFNSADFLRTYGGGGHAPAAGATINQSLHPLMDEIIGNVKAQLQTTMMDPKDSSQKDEAE